MYSNRFDYYGGFPVINPPAAVFITPVIDAAPVEIKREAPGEFQSRMLRRYREKGYPLGKTKRGFKKWLKNLLVKALGCKSFKAALRKYKIK